MKPQAAQNPSAEPQLCVALTRDQDWSQVLRTAPRESEILRRGSLGAMGSQGQEISSAESVGIYGPEQSKNPLFCIWKGPKGSNLMTQEHAALQAHDQAPWFPSPRLIPHPSVPFLSWSRLLDTDCHKKTYPGCGHVRSSGIEQGHLSSMGLFSDSVCQGTMSSLFFSLSEVCFLSLSSSILLDEEGHIKITG